MKSIFTENSAACQRCHAPSNLPITVRYMVTSQHRLAWDSSRTHHKQYANTEGF